MNDLSHIDKEFVEHCIETGKLQLNDEERSKHFAPVKYFGIGSIIFFGFGLYEIFTKGFIFDIHSSGCGLILGAAGFVIISLYLYRLQNNALEFLSFESDLPLNEKRKFIKKTGRKIHWDKVLDNQNIIVGKISNIFLWGERVTIILNGKTVMINSISDPSKKPNIFAPNYKHINAFVDEFNRK